MSVDTFDPSSLGKGMDEAAVRDLIAYARGFSGDQLTLSELEVARFAPLAAHGEWAQKVADLTDEELVGLIRLFTLGEMRYPSWFAGDKSPVIVLVKTLKARKTYDPSLTRWIKANTTNKFLPHGSLLDRL